MRRTVSPVNDLAYWFDQMDRVTQDLLGQSVRSRVSTLPIDVYDRGDELVVRAYVPGVHPESLDIQIDDGVLTISGSFAELYDKEEAASWSWYVRELRHGAFQRSMNLPYKIDTENVDASIEDGILWLKMPKAVEARPVRVKVNAASATPELTASESTD